MAFVDDNGIWPNISRTALNTFNFGGRARRTEAAYWWLTAAAVLLVGGILMGVTLPAAAQVPAAYAMAAVFGIPSVALFVRRVHDQDRTGWWALLLLMSFLSGQALNMLETDTSFSAAVDDLAIETLRWSRYGLTFATLVLYVLPGKKGPNRYGPDPRESNVPT
jgi:uncharacterized membrane protein YhaH (DUF805 family)